MRVSIDQATCQGDCICSVIRPEVFVLDDDGLAWVANDGTPVATGGFDSFAVVPPEYEDDVLDAAQQCPTGAIRVER
jgi:ferredoxin